MGVDFIAHIRLGQAVHSLRPFPDYGLCAQTLFFPLALAVGVTVADLAPNKRLINCYRPGHHGIVRDPAYSYAVGQEPG